MNENLKRQGEAERAMLEADKKLAEAADHLRGNPDLGLILISFLNRAEEIRTFLCQPYDPSLPVDFQHLQRAEWRGRVSEIEDLLDTFKEQDTDTDAQHDE